VGSRRLTVRTLPFVLVANGQLPLARVNHALAMNEEEIENRFDEIYYEMQVYKKKQLQTSRSRGIRGEPEIS
jgi:hypothetical protein